MARKRREATEAPSKSNPAKSNPAKSNPAKSNPADSNQSGRFAYDGLDRVMHEKARLGILASLAAHNHGLLFNDLKQLCSLTDGNLSRHLGVLTDAGFIEIWKSTGASRQQTLYRLTADGRARFTEYIGILEGIVSDAQTKTDVSKTGRRELPRGWSPAT